MSKEDEIIVSDCDNSDFASGLENCFDKTRCHAIAGRTARCRYKFRHNGIMHAVTVVQNGFLVFRPTSPTVQMLG